MTDLRKAAEMALEALAIHEQHGYMPIVLARNATNALRQALAQPEQEPLGGEWVPCVKLPIIVHVRNQRDGETHISTREGITPVLPDDLIMRGVAGEEYPIGRELFERTYTFDTAPKPEYVTEVVAMHENGTRTIKQTLIQKREWVGLTDEEIITHFKTNVDTGSLLSFADGVRYAEAKLKEKNA